jgi:hypothetical protein
MAVLLVSDVAAVDDKASDRQRARVLGWSRSFNRKIEMPQLGLV